MTVYLSPAQILAIHRAQLARFGGGGGVRDLGALEAAVARPAMTFGGEDLYPDLAGKAAALMHSLVMNHPFLDGNKRTAVIAAELFIDVNGGWLEATDEDLEGLTMSVARGELGVEPLTIWIRQRLTPE